LQLARIALGQIEPWRAKLPRQISPPHADHPLQPGRG
jgi:hypothetical protein